MRRKISITIAITLVTLAALSLAVLSGALTPAAPTGWAHIRVGMSRDEVLRLAGPPQLSGWPEKIVEVWERKNPICNRRLFISYKVHPGPPEAATVESLWEGTWLRGYGWLHPRKQLR